MSWSNAVRRARRSGASPELLSYCLAMAKLERSLRRVLRSLRRLSEGEERP